MASELGPSVNGVYNGQYGQPAELAASVPSSSQPSTASQPTADPATSNSVTDPQQIGWYFVEQYYTTLSKHPDRLHLFYSKKSQLLTGVEAEKVLPSVGQKAIKEKIQELGIQDCKVRVLNVDCQTSLNNIIVQVIGVISNQSAPSKKYVQTFVLTPQTNGYYVLNDIFRYLNDEEDEIVEDEPTGQQQLPTGKTESEEPPTVHADAGSINNAASVEEVSAKLEEVAITAEEPTVNGTDSTDLTEESTAKEMTAEALGGEVENPIAPENPPEPDPTPARSPPPPTSSAPVAEAAPSKKTWANLVGSKAAAVPAIPHTTPTGPAQPKVSQPSTAAGAPPPSQTGTADEQGNSSVSPGSEWQTADHGKKQSRPQSKSLHEGNVLGYIKNVTEKIEASTLRVELEKYGELKYFDISRQKNSAFVEFATPAGYVAAVAANPHQVGSEQVYVEERRPRPHAFGGSNAGFTRGGPNAGRGRGGVGGPGRIASQGGGFGKDGGRGSFSPRGNGGKPGTMTPKGRGHSPAV